MVEEEIQEIDQEIRGLEELEKEAKALEEADARAVEAAREKKRLRKKKARQRKILIFLILILSAFLGTGIYYIQKQQKAAATNATVEIIAEDGQTVIYAQIESIQGNEITYKEMESETIAALTRDAPDIQGKNPSETIENIEDIKDTGSGKPVITKKDHNGKSKTVQIPVGTEVTTMLGAVTTFSRLSADDIIAMVMDEDEIIRIYIVGQAG